MVNTVICMSGGVDSIIAWHYLGKPKAVYFDLGTKYTKKEIYHLEQLKKIVPGFDFEIDTTLRELGALEVGRTAFVPYRNLLFATICAAKYGDDIIICGIKGDNVCDKNPTAFTAMSRCLTSTGTKQVIVRSPFWDMTKSQIISWFIANTPNAKQILKTSVSCYNGGEQSCGVCASCLRKWFALRYLGIDCADWFAADPRASPEIPGYIERMRRGEYDALRTREMLTVLVAEGLMCDVDQSAIIQMMHKRRYI
ncbi:MAG: 7-cyano-7-deazaguanine synthase [Methanogenium sp.]